jgi:hypothetical protein
MKLGKLAPKVHPKTLKLSAFLKATAPPPPPRKLWREYKIQDWGMFANDTVGDCTCAAVAHMLMLVTAHTGGIVIPELSDIMAMYSAITGYDPSKTDRHGNNPTDTGAAVTDVLAYWQGTGIAGHKILGWAQIDQNNLTMRQQGMYIFGANDVGVDLPANAMDQFDDLQDWDVAANDGGIDGGHCIVETGYGSKGSNFVTWGANQKATNEWSAKYVDEAYVVITQDWINNADGLAPNSMDLDALNAALTEIRA